jgi:D-lyxose ketol-isomerase
MGGKCDIDHLEHIMQIWAAQNLTEHGTNAEEKIERKKGRLTIEITRIQRNKEVSNEEDRKFLKTPID